MSNKDSKPCKICHKIKPLTEFNKDSQLKSGLSSYCRACSKIKWIKYKENRNIRNLPPGFTQEDATEVPLSLEEKLIDAYESLDVYDAKGVLVMKKGKVLDEEWYKKKLNKLRKGRKD